MEEQIPGGQRSNGSHEKGDVEKWASLIGGGVLALAGLRDRSLRGALLTLAGGSLAYHGATGDKSLGDRIAETTGLSNQVRVEKSVTVFGKTPEELYSYWRNLENLPTFMYHVERIDVLSETRSRWVTSTPIKNGVTWEAEIVVDRPNELIVWASVEDSDIQNSGFVRFQSAPMNQGTEVKLVLEYSPPGGSITAAIAKLFGEEAEQRMGDELRRFKMLMEAGEIATIEGQPTCQGRHK
ncbi:MULTISPECIES: SRPBCC family protein [unclassified Leptolyngbya]|uniref:SRPBCC family protein n=1 Tax=unclassified Leptolyngbya TaxID=2650499 RepID=UPI001687D33D|nr:MULTISPECIES: SRPBCC family protein [unclassified Leptolyngbya]MBD1909994.1 cyclase [Leptolyngbya sp. FACHB-8]MBD2157131.1 cyclase [Leptolyngbya sp. FACHB-16]